MCAVHVHMYMCANSEWTQGRRDFAARFSLSLWNPNLHRRLPSALGHLLLERNVGGVHPLECLLRLRRRVFVGVHEQRLLTERLGHLHVHVHMHVHDRDRDRDRVHVHVHVHAQCVGEGGGGGYR